MEHLPSHILCLIPFFPFGRQGWHNPILLRALYFFTLEKGKGTSLEVKALIRMQHLLAKNEQQIAAKPTRSTVIIQSFGKQFVNAKTKREAGDIVKIPCALRFGVMGTVLLLFVGRMRLIYVSLQHVTQCKSLFKKQWRHLLFIQITGTFKRIYHTWKEWGRCWDQRGPDR